MRTGAYAVAILPLVVVAACGGDVQERSEVIEVPPVPPNRYPAAVKEYRPEFPLLLSVTEGIVVLYDRIYDEATRLFQPQSCASYPGVRATVAPFRLMLTEVTNEMYAACVRADGCEPPDANLDSDPIPGAWDDPGKAKRPVALGYKRAFDFCRIYGGELPSQGQFIRATEGETPGFGIKALTERYTLCGLGEDHPMCDVLYEAAAGGFTNHKGEPQGPGLLGDVASVEWDVGPFGHRDLFGNAWEWVRAIDNERWPPKDSGCSVWQEDRRYDATMKAPQPGEDAFHLGRSCKAGAGFKLGQLSAETRFRHAPMSIKALGGLNGTLGPDERNGFRCAFPP